MRRDYFNFDGVSSLAYGVWLSGATMENRPARDVSKHKIPGRNGTLVTDNGRWDEVEISYSCAILSDFSKEYGNLMARLSKARGHRRLWDSLHPDHFRLGAFHMETEPNTTPYNKAGQFLLRFSCRPERFLIAGERAVRFDAPGTLLNPTLFPAQPVITVTGDGPGVLSVGGRDVVFLEQSGGVVLDCESMDAFARTEGGVESRTSWIHAPEFPVLEPGKNQISFSGGITAVEIVPRWWTL